MLKQRIISAVIGIPLLIIVGIYGGIPLKIAMLLLAIIAYWEFNRANNNGVGLSYVDLIGYLYIIAFFVLDKIIASSILIYVYFIILMAIAILNKQSANSVFTRVAGFIYTVIPFLILLKIRDVDIKYFWLVFIIAFATDTFAYFTGRFFGRRKLCPDVSPNKTVAGFIGGTLGCIIVAYFYILLYLHSKHIFLLIALIGSIISQLGDLSASYIKRNCRIKDFSNIIPGHGGILDRFDSILYVSVIIYIFVERNITFM
ncbi:phosphatidate cytidylyltransferase [Caldanaerobius fijiensis DSM 17918]|uniref:Phosphatidate cytidylyltransferase n=1 Tax=Caldanaerobius fijiensis DSM 17918 TaxID=1121256 RepID=A0A1M4XIP4_9THEO|nr:phosphatidate cytidylyltransferase [Caldanaerobius fijiensis]SHE93424.1 phosphatidate cytidylyltransferase [Caldanaerobius fijiensis DSM 17918]